MQTIGRPILAVVIILAVSLFQGCAPVLRADQSAATVSPVEALRHE